MSKQIVFDGVRMSMDQIKTYIHTPSNKDMERVKNIKSEAKGTAQANSIKDMYKLICRARAYTIVYGKSVENPFLKKMKDLGFSNMQIIGIVNPEVGEKMYDNSRKNR